MNFYRFLILIPILLSPALCFGQFYSAGDDPASAKWNYMESPNFKVIYPIGTDSLARIYIHSLEKYRTPLGLSAGLVPGEKMKRKMPVVLHPFSAISNGSVAWAPKRMDLYTCPSPYVPEAMPWIDMLAVHESRHVSQMQYGLSGVFRPFKYIFGEGTVGVFSGIFPDRWLLEGDAVVAETALGISGRGRSTDFLNYYRIAFDDGDFRNIHKWAYGSYKHYTPNHYAFGYMIISGMRTMHGATGFTANLMRQYARRPYDLAARSTISKKMTGKRFRDAADEIMRQYNEMWSAEDALREPYSHSVQISKPAKRYTVYSDNLIVRRELYTLKTSLDKSRRLVKVDGNRKETVIRPFASNVGMLYYCEKHDRIFWSETIPDVRWTMKGRSVIRSYDLKTGKIKNVTQKEKYFNPSKSQDDSKLAVSEYSDDGKAFITVISDISGEILHRHQSPDSLQILESAWLGGKIYLTGLSANGYGIYCVDSEKGGYDVVLQPSPVKIFNFGTAETGLMFTSDRNGNNELYFMDVDSGKVYQETSVRYGAVDFTYSYDGRFMICSAADKTGAPLIKIKREDLMHKEVDFFDRYIYTVAEKLSEQERQLARQKGIDITAEPDVTVSEPERYRKFPNMFNFHTWLPFFLNYDNISDLSFENLENNASLGATGFLQNRLGTFTGNLGYSARPDAYDKKYWRHSAHLNLTYSGLYPVFELSMSFNDRAAYSYREILTIKDLQLMYGIASGRRKSPSLRGNLSVYIPFNFSSGGWRRGLVPKVTYSLSNDFFRKSGSAPSNTNGTNNTNSASNTNGTINTNGANNGRASLMQMLAANVRYYTMLSTAHSEVYPDWGIGIEAGGRIYPDLMTVFSPAFYLYSYGYIPGITGAQGLRLSATWQQQATGNARFTRSYLNMLPRGMQSNDYLLENQHLLAARQVKLTADYAIPFYMGDFHIGNVFYVQRGIVTPHFDWTFIGKHNLWSAGASLTVDFGNFFGFVFPLSLGITCSYNGGSLFEAFADSGVKMDRFYVGPVFTMNIQ